MRLSFWSRSATDERRHAISTLQSLGPTSIPGLAAALSWSVPRTQRVLHELQRGGPPGLVYDARTGTIRWGAPSPVPPPPASVPPGAGATWAISAARPAPRSAPAAPPSYSAPSFAARGGYARPTVTPVAPQPTAWTLGADAPHRDCSRCRIALVPTGTADLYACPMCGRRVTGAGALVSPTPSPSGTPAGPDPKVQQLIAAWASGQPAPCPQCRQPLRHTADGEFRCSSCGTRVAYGTSTKSGAAASAVPGGTLVGPSH